MRLLQYMPLVYTSCVLSTHISKRTLSVSLVMRDSVARLALVGAANITILMAIAAVPYDRRCPLMNVSVSVTSAAICSETWCVSVCMFSRV